MPTAAARPPSLFNHLMPSVRVVTRGAGVRDFDDSRELFAFLEGLPARGDALMSIQRGREALVPDSVAALETMLWLEGFTTFKRAAKRASRPAGRFGTKYAWAYLGEYLGWDWRSL